MPVYLVLLIYSVFFGALASGSKRGLSLAWTAASSARVVRWDALLSKSGEMEASIISRGALPGKSGTTKRQGTPSKRKYSMHKHVREWQRALPNPRKATKIVPLPELSLSTSPPLQGETATLMVTIQSICLQDTTSHAHRLSFGSNQHFPLPQPACMRPLALRTHAREKAHRRAHVEIVGQIRKEGRKHCNSR